MGLKLLNEKKSFEKGKEKIDFLLHNKKSWINSYMCSA